MTRVTTADGTGLDVHTSGRGDGRGAVLLHGLTGNASVWAFAGPALAPRFHVLGVDQRGHGSSERSSEVADFSLERLASDVFDVLDHFGLERSTVIGHGMGGTVAMLAALQAPERVEAMVLVGSAAVSLDPSSGWMVTRDRAVEAVERAGMEAGWEAYLESGIFGWDPAEMPVEIVEDWRQQFLQAAPAAFVGLSRDLGRQADLTERLRSLTDLPTLVVCGTDDAAYAPYAEPLTKALPRGELLWIADGGHTPQLAKGEEFGAAVFDFLRKVLPSGTGR